MNKTQTNNEQTNNERPETVATVTYHTDQRYAQALRDGLRNLFRNAHYTCTGAIRDAHTLVEMVFETPVPLPVLNRMEARVRERAPQMRGESPFERLEYRAGGWQ